MPRGRDTETSDLVLVRNTTLGLSAAVAASCASAPPAPVAATPPTQAVARTTTESELRLDVGGWRVIERESGPVNYYALVSTPAPPRIRAEYRPPYRTAVLGYELDDRTREKAVRLRWKWRAVTLPDEGDECVSGKGDASP